MREEPLFVRFANGTVNARDIIQSFLSSSSHEPSITIAKGTLDAPYELSTFRKDFVHMLQDLTENGISQRIINYINSYMKPSLEEIVTPKEEGRAGETRYITIKGPDTPWMEAVVCYNLCLYIKVYGIQEIKQCPVCSKYFTNKGKYAKYCSEACKGQKS